MSSVGQPIFDAGDTAPEVPQAPIGRGPNPGGIALLVLVAVGLLLLAFRTDDDAPPEVVLPTPTTVPADAIDDFVAAEEEIPAEPRFPPSGYTLQVVQTVIANPTAIRDSYGGFVAGSEPLRVGFITSDRGLQWSRNNVSDVVGLWDGLQSDRLYVLPNGRLIGSFVTFSRRDMVVATSDDGVLWEVGLDRHSVGQLSMPDLEFADAHVYMTIEERRGDELIVREQLQANWDLQEFEPVPLEPGSRLRAMTSTFSGLVAIRTDDVVFGPPGSNHEMVTVQNGVWGSFGSEGLEVADVIDLHVSAGKLHAVTSTAIYRRVPRGGPWVEVAEFVPEDSGLQFVEHRVGPLGGAVLLKDTTKSIEQGQYVILTSNDLTNWTTNRIVEQFSSMQVKTVGRAAILEGFTPGTGPQRVRVPLV